MAAPLIQQETIKYKTYIKEVIVEALRTVFSTHPDDIIRDKTKIDVDFPLDEVDYPAIIIRFYERSIRNAGVGHVEHLPTPTDPLRFYRYKHFLYQGDIEFAVYALSSHDRDLVSDALVQILTMGDTEPYTMAFLDRIYDPPSRPDENEGGAYDPSMDHMINLNTDQIQGFGETQTIAPWLPEDTLIYQTSYRIEARGEFYSRTPVSTTYGLVENVESYPYNADNGEPKPNPNPTDPAVWETPGVPLP
jgi:hypothetical protein